MRIRLPIVLLLSVLITSVSNREAVSQSNSGSERPTRYSKQHQFFIPFTADLKRPIAELRLFVQRNGADWEYLTTAKPTQKGFNFFTNQDGTYGMAVQTVYQDGTLEPAKDQLAVDLKVVVDTIPPKINLHAFSTNDAAGVEWDIVDEYLDPSSIRLEYRWPGMVDWAPIDKGVQFRARDQRTWVLKPDQSIEIRVRASDLAKNEAVSAGVKTSPGIGDSRQFGSGTGMGNPNTGIGEQVQQRSNGSHHFVNSTTVKLNYNVTVGPSGLRKVSLWRLDDKQTWTKIKEQDPTELRSDKEAPAVMPGERPRTETLTLVDDVKKDGSYGYTIIVESRAGTSGREPKMGDSPQISVEVDTTQPIVKMSEPKVRPNGTASQGALVDIVWQATDKNMAPAPITIEYSEKQDGPWRVIAEKIDNSGKYTWAVPPTEPYSFFVRVKAIDRAGNVGMDVSKQNVIVDLTVPQVEIKEVTPGNGPGRPER